MSDFENGMGRPVARLFLRYSETRWSSGGVDIFGIIFG